MKKILQDFMNKMKKAEVPCFIFMVSDEKGKPKFIEVIVKRPYRYIIKGI